MIRVNVYIDGFNLYHAIANLKKPKLKWLDLSLLVNHFIDPNIHIVQNIYYFSAYATWRPNSVIKHKTYVSALESKGILPVMGKFKNKERYCKSCKGVSEYHEEKETDVNIAISVIGDAYKDLYDEAFIISQDSDLFPAIRLVNAEFPNKKIKIITPPNLHHSKEMARVVGKKKLAKIQVIHLERALFPDLLLDKSGNIICCPDVWN